VHRKAFPWVCPWILCVHKYAFFGPYLDIVRAKDTVFVCVPGYSAYSVTLFGVRPWIFRVHRDAVFGCVRGHCACTKRCFGVCSWIFFMRKGTLLGSVAECCACTGTPFIECVSGYCSSLGNGFGCVSGDSACTCLSLDIMRAHGRRMFRASLAIACAHVCRFWGASLSILCTGTPFSSASVDIVRAERRRLSVRPW
jgi:hypothetical protein